MIEDMKPDLIFITETWLHPDIKNAEVMLSGFSDPIRKDRTGRRGGGCIMYAKQGLTLREEVIVGSEDTASVWATLFGGNGSKTTIGLCYVPPNDREADVKLHHIYREVCRENKQCVIIGDFNHRTIDWDIPRAEHADQEFLEAVQDCYLTQHVREPTRGENILDLILITEEHMIEDTTILPPLSNSDHNVISFSLIVEERLSDDSTVRIVGYNKADWEGIRDVLGRVEWDEWLTDKATTEENLETFTNILESACKGIPTRKKTRRKRSVWMNRKARKAIRKKTKTWKKYRQTGNAEDHDRYRKALYMATKTVKTAKGDFEIKFAAEIKNDSKSFFSYARSKLRTKEQIGPLRDTNGNLIEEPKLMAILLNEFFSSVFTTEDLTNIPSLECQVELMADITIGAAEVQRKLQDLRTGKAPGADLVHPRLLKELAVQVAYPLAIIFQQSIAQSRVPQQWRTANVIPIFKKGSKRDAANYRPISLTSHIGKLLERIIRDHILRHLDSKQLIKPSQHGFLPGRSCQTNLLEFLERVTDDTDRGNNTDVAYLDFAKAFDKVPHARLLVKLKALGVNNQVSSWIEAWLRHRRQRVVVGGEEFDWSAVSSGVPQGSILGPILFIVYINDLDEKMTSTVLKFADDTKISSNSQQELQRDLDTAVEWAKTWQIQFDTNKCKVMHVGHRNERTIYNMGNHRLEEVEEEKDLGVLIHRTLSVSNNCDVAVKKADQMAGHIYRPVTHKSVHTVVPLYKALVRPHLEYCSLVWSPYLKKDILSIEKVQRRVTKMIPSISALTYE